MGDGDDLKREEAWTALELQVFHIAQILHGSGLYEDADSRARRNSTDTPLRFSSNAGFSEHSISAQHGCREGISVLKTSLWSGPTQTTACIQPVR